MNATDLKLPAIDNRHKQRHTGAARSLANRNITANLGPAFAVTQTASAATPMPAMPDVPAEWRPALAGENRSTAPGSGGSFGGSARQLANQLAAANHIPADKVAETTARIANSRQRYGLRHDGSSPTPSGAAKLLASRTDLSFAEKAAKSIDISNMRKANENRYKESAARRAANQISKNQQLAELQKRYQIAALTRAATLGSQSAAQTLGAIAREQAQIHQNLARLHQANLENQTSLEGIRSKETIAGTIARQQAEQFAKNQEFNREKLAQDRLLKEMQLRLQDQQHQGKLAQEQAQFQAERDDAKTARLNNNEDFNRIITALQSGKNPDSVLTGYAKSIMAERLHESGDTGKKLLTIPASNLPKESPPAARAKDFIDRVNMIFGFTSDPSRLPDPELSAIAATLHGVTASDISRYLDELDAELQGITEAPTGPEMVRWNQRILARQILSADPWGTAEE